MYSEDFGSLLTAGLCVASGDLRNVIKTIAELPASFTGLLEITMNDDDFDVVARNIIMLLVAFTVRDTSSAIDTIIHIWYSVLVRQSDVEVLESVRHHIQDAYDSFEDVPGPQLLSGELWAYENSPLAVSLPEHLWQRLLDYTRIPDGLTAELATEVYQKTSLAEDTKDVRHRDYLALSGPHRVAKERFREDGLLLPFGASREPFQYPNP